MIDTRFLTAQQWAAQTVPIILKYGGVPRLDREEDWRSWAAAVVALPALAAVAAPRPEAFSDWREWAQRFNQAARLLGN